MSEKFYPCLWKLRVLMINFLFLRGFVLLIVNVASKCGYTDRHYKELVELDKMFHSLGLRILAFPCNQFGGQVNMLL